MRNFSITTQVEDELKDFRTSRVKLASVSDTHDESVRFAKQKQNGYYFNQMEAITIIDLYYNSKFQNGLRDRLGQRKLFLNVGKFRTDVAAKQIELDSKDFRFVPDLYADPFTAFFLQKDFHEWAKERDSDDTDDASLGDLANKLGDNFPRYGTIVVKKVGNRLRNVPLQNLRNEQSAKSLQTARYVIEEHDMYGSEIQDMADEAGWDLGDQVFVFNKKYKVFERYGHVPSNWLRKVRTEQFGDDPGLVPEAKDGRSEDAVVIMTKEAGRDGSTTHIFYANAIPEGRPYREKHWSRQHGRWLGIGVMEDLVENQEAKNIVVNLQRRSLHWASKRIGQSNTTDAVGKNLIADVPDGSILEVGPGGQITMLDLSNRSLGEFQQTLNEWEKNADQKAFTYDVATGNNLPASTPATIGVILSSAVKGYYGKKRQMLAGFLRDAILDFFLPQFLEDMGDEARVVSLMSGERGFETIKAACMQFVRTEATRISLLSGKPVDVNTIVQAVQPFEVAKALFVKLPKKAYKEAKYTFDFIGTEDDDLTDLKSQLSTLTTIYQALMAAGDRARAEKVLERIAELGGVDIDAFGSMEAPQQPTNPANPANPAPGQPVPSNVRPAQPANAGASA